MGHMSCVMCHMANVKCHVSCVTFFSSLDKVLELDGGGSVINLASPLYFFYSILATLPLRLYPHLLNKIYILVVIYSFFLFFSIYIAKKTQQINSYYKKHNPFCSSPYFFKINIVLFRICFIKQWGPPTSPHFRCYLPFLMTPPLLIYQVYVQKQYLNNLWCQKIVKFVP